MRLLVSVRNRTEAAIAFRSGARLIDLKEPANGPLGRVAPAVARQIGIPQANLSLALGEWDELPPDSEALRSFLVLEAGFLKWGLAGAAGKDWPGFFVRLRERLPAATVPVIAAYADHERAGSPSPEALLDFVRRHAWRNILFDTFRKDGSTLLDWLPLPILTELCTVLRSLGCRVALAGSLTRTEIPLLLPLRPDIIAVRGAACIDGARNGPIDAHRVAELVRLLSDGSGGRHQEADDRARTPGSG